MVCQFQLPYHKMRSVFTQCRGNVENRASVTTYSSGYAIYQSVGVHLSATAISYKFHATICEESIIAGAKHDSNVR